MFRKPCWKFCILAAAIASIASPPAGADNLLFNAGNYAGPNPITAADSVAAVLGGDKNFSGISLTNAGSFYWTVADRIGFISSSLTNNNVFDIQDDASLTYAGGSASAFVNNATFQKSGGSASTTIGSGISFTNNAGIINAASGTINFASGSATFNADTQFNGGGVNRVSSNASFNGAIASVNLSLVAGTFTGGDAVISGAVDWRGGKVSGTWTLLAGQTLNARSGTDKDFYGASFINNGTVGWQSADGVGFVSSSFVNNGLFDIRDDASLTYTGGSASSFVNNAMLQKSGGSGTTTIGGGINFTNNAGIINAASGTIEFTGGSATFNAGTQFNGGGINRVSSNASFNGGFTAGNLQLTAGTFTGGDAVVSGAVDWRGGKLSGTWTLPAGQTLNARSGTDKDFYGTSFINNGTVGWQSADRVGFVSSSFFNNGLFDIRDDASLTYTGGSASSFVNNATLQKSGGSGTTTIGGGINFTNNAGIINAATGTIDFAGGSATFNAGTQFNGAGINRVSSSASFNGGFTAGNLQLTAGTFTGGDAVITGAIDWSGGKLSGTWTLPAGQTLNAKAGTDKDFYGASFVNRGTLNWQSAERVGFVSSSFTNEALFDVQSDASLTQVSGSASSFVNNATFRKSGGGSTTTIGGGINFTNNAGIINAATGTIDFAGGSATFNAGTQFNGAGINRVSSSASFNGGFTAGNLQLTAGTFTGGDAVITGAIDWSGGKLSGTWALPAGQTLNAKAGTDKDFYGASFVNGGTVGWQSADRVAFVSSSFVNNGLFDIRDDASLTYAGGSASSFINNATLQKSGGSGTTTIGGGINFTNNAGIINAAFGTIDFAGGSATFNAGTQFNGAGINRVSSNASFNGGFTAGNLQLTAGTFTGGDAVITGAIDWSGGKLSGTWTVSAGQTLNARSGTDKDLYGASFVNNGTVRWQSANRVGFVSSSVVNNGLFDIQDDANLTYAGGSASSFVNSGTLRKGGGGGTSIIGSSVIFSNPGTVEAQTGTLVLPDNFSNPGTITGGATIQTTKLTNSGHVAPGNSPGTLTLVGNFEQSAAGVLDIELASSVLFDKFVVNGTAKLDGTLALHCIGACTLNANDTFVILNSTGNLSGTFAGVTASGFGNGFNYSVRYDYAAALVELRVIQPGVPLPVPEPETWAMLIAGLGLVGALARRKSGLSSSVS